MEMLYRKNQAEKTKQQILYILNYLRGTNTKRETYNAAKSDSVLCDILAAILSSSPPPEQQQLPLMSRLISGSILCQAKVPGCPCTYKVNMLR